MASVANRPHRSALMQICTLFMYIHVYNGPGVLGVCRCGISITANVRRCYVKLCNVMRVRAISYPSNRVHGYMWPVVVAAPVAAPVVAYGHMTVPCVTKSACNSCLWGG